MNISETVPSPASQQRCSYILFSLKKQTRFYLMPHSSLGRYHGTRFAFGGTGNGCRASDYLLAEDPDSLWADGRHNLHLHPADRVKFVLPSLGRVSGLF